MEYPAFVIFVSMFSNGDLGVSGSGRKHAPVKKFNNVKQFF